MFIPSFLSVTSDIEDTYTTSSLYDEKLGLEIIQCQISDNMAVVFEILEHTRILNRLFQNLILLPTQMRNIAQTAGNTVVPKIQFQMDEMLRLISYIEGKAAKGWSTHGTLSCNSTLAQGLKY